jgi:heme A synthase
VKGYHPAFRRLVIGTVILLIATGLLLAPTTLYMRLQWGVPWRLPGEPRLWTAALHTLVSYLMVCLLGILWMVHMRAGWRRKRNHWSGIAMASLMALLTLTGVAVFYLGETQSSAIASAIHLVLGLCVPFFFIYHYLNGRQQRFPHDRAAIS